jgi:hypothetical protein
VVWGENSAFEYGSADDADTGFRLDEKWLKTYGVTQGTGAQDWLDEDLSRSDLAAYFGPSADGLGQAQINAVFLGYYLPWDPRETARVAMRHGFSTASSARTGIYDFADIDDDFISLHHWMKWYKFGFTRAFDNLSLEIRNGRMTRNEALRILAERGDDMPHGDIEKFCAFANIDKTRFLAIAESFRNTDVWKKDAGGRWYIPEFPVLDWAWAA